MSSLVYLCVGLDVCCVDACLVDVCLLDVCLVDVCQCGSAGLSVSVYVALWQCGSVSMCVRAERDQHVY